MEKISRILPSSPRVSSTDLRNSGVARPGAPSFGRPVGVSALATPKFDGMAQAAGALKDLRAEREPTFKKDPHVDIVEKISRDFFAKGPKVDELTEGVDPSAEIVARFHDGDSDLNPLTSEDAPMVGSQLDVMA